MTKYLLTLLLLTMVACTTYVPAKKIEVVNVQVFDKSKDQVWEKVIEFFAKNNLSIKTLEKASGIIATDLKQIPQSLDSICWCGQSGGGVHVNYNTIKGVFNVFIKEHQQGTEVTVTSDFTSQISGYDVVYRQMSVVDINCYSNGKLEKQIFDFIGK